MSSPHPKSLHSMAIQRAGMPSLRIRAQTPVWIAVGRTADSACHS